ncbi:type II secretion system protein [Aeromonas caviae]|uniref:type II secretion system protein n=1 Tax=Aeromonas caviae TaxID=648 RepID=UPI0030DC4016
MSKLQRGFTLIELMIVLSILATVSFFYFQEQQEQRIFEKSISQAKRIEDVLIKAGERYQVNAKAGGGITPSYFPSSIQVLLNEGYLSNCTAAQHAAGVCAPMTYTLWGEVITSRAYGVGGNPSIPRFEITIPLAQVPIQQRDQVASIMLERLPFGRVSGNNIITEIGRPGTEIAHDGFYLLDGSRPLTGDMQAAGKAIENVKDISISGLTNRTVLSGLTWTSVLQNSQVVPLINCPTGRSNRKVIVTPLSYNKNGKPFNKIGAVMARYDSGKAYVQVWETNNDGSQSWFIPAPQYASVQVNQSCNK